MRFPSVVLLAGVLSLAACESVSDSGPTGPFTLSLPEPWPGSTVYVSSPDFRRGFTSATLRVDTFTIQLTKSALNDSTVSGTLPTSVSGELTTEVTVNDTRFPTRTLTVAGFAGLRTIPGSTAAFIGEIYPWLKSGVASIIGETDLRTRLLDLEQGTVRDLTSVPAVPDVYPGASATYRAGVYARKGANNTVDEWDFNGAPVVESQGISSQTGWVHTRLGPNLWMAGDDDYTWFFTRSGPGAPYIQSERFPAALYGTNFSPRGDLLAIVGARNLAPFPVYSLPSGTVAFTVPMRAVRQSAFSQDGNLLVSVGETPTPVPSQRRLVIQDANNGAVRLDTTFTEDIVAVAGDPTQPRFYAALRTATGQLVIQVYSTTTLQPIARLATPQADRSVGAGVIVVSPLKGLYFYLPEDLAPVQSRIWHFTLPESN
ncbi:MAG: hypothetical protein V4558_04490 [Gemmatimonadota bacterium]